MACPGGGSGGDACGLGPDRLVNRRSTTWRGLSEMEKEAPAERVLAEPSDADQRPVIRDVTAGMRVGTPKSAGPSGWSGPHLYVASQRRQDMRNAP